MMVQLKRAAVAAALFFAVTNELGGAPLIFSRLTFSHQRGEVRTALLNHSLLSRRGKFIFLSQSNMFDSNQSICRQPLSAIDHQYCTVDKAGCVRTKKDGSVLDVLD